MTKLSQDQEFECKECSGLGKIELIVNGRFTGLVETCGECNKEVKNYINEINKTRC